MKAPMKAMLRGLSCLALTYALSFVAAPSYAATGTGKPAASRSSPRATAAVRARDKARLAYQRDLVSVLAPRADPLPLLAAALLARPLANQPKYNSFHSLIERAAAAEGAGAAISWTQLADCDAKAGACPAATALARLTTQAPNNAAVWLLKFGDDTRDLQQDAARADLAKAANAKLYDDYTGTALQALASSIGVLPPSVDTLNPAQAAGAAGMQAMLVYGLAGTQLQPNLQLVARLCESAGSDASIKADCLQLGKLLEWGSSPLSRSLGLHLREVLADDPAQQDDARRARRNLIWQVQNFAHLSARAPADAALAQHLLALARNGGTEMSLLLAVLRDYSIPVDAPTDWKPNSAH